MADMYHLNLHLSNVVVMCLNFLHGRNYHDGYILLVYRLQFAQTLTWAAGTCCWGQAFGLYHRSGGAICYIYIYTFVGEKHASIRMDSGEQSYMVCIKHETRIVVSILDIWFLNIFVCIYTQIGQFESWSVRFSCWQFFFVIKWRNMWLQYSTGLGEYHASNIMDRHHPGILGDF